MSTAAASFGIARRTLAGAGEMRSPSSTASRRSLSAASARALSLFGPFRRDVADQQAERAGGKRRDDLLVELREVEQRGEREDEGGEAGGTRQDRVADLLGRACFHRSVRPARRQFPPDAPALKNRG